MEHEQGVLAGAAPDGAAHGSAAGHPLSSLVLNTRTYNVLCRHGVSTVEQLIQLDEAALRGMSQVNVKTVAEIQAALATWETRHPPRDSAPAQQAVLAPWGPALSLAPPPTEDTPLSRIPCLWEEWSLPPWLVEDYTPLSALGLGTRAHNALRHSGRVTVRQVALLKMGELAGVRNIGRGTIEDLRLFLAEYATAPGRQPSPPPLPPKSAPMWGVAPLAQPVEPGYPFAEIVSIWLEETATRDRLVITRHVGLDGDPPQNLEEIGQIVGVTRERVRQIVAESCRRLVELQKGELLRPHRKALRRYLADRDGIASVEEIRRDVGLYLDLGGFDALLSCQILAEADDKLKWLPRLRLLRNDSTSQNHIVTARRELRRLLSEGGNTLPLSQLPLACSASRSFQEHCGQMNQDFFLACLRTDPDVTIADGVITWPGRLGGAARRLIVAVRELGVPAHYCGIAAKVNAALRETKRVTARTVHALLQHYPGIFVRVARGTYGLVEWDLPADDALAGCIHDLLVAHGEPLAVGEIVTQMEATQVTDRGAVQAVLSTDSRFRHVGRETYGLATWKLSVPETMAEVAVRVLTEAAQPLSVRELTDRVLAIRHGSRSTMPCVLTKDARFVRVSAGVYGLAQWGGEG